MTVSAGPLRRWLYLATIVGLCGCALPTEATTPYGQESIDAAYQRIASDLRGGKPIVVTVDVVLCDNRHVNCGTAAGLGNGSVPGRNLYWGAQYGLKTMFGKATDWREELVELSDSGSKGTFVLACDSEPYFGSLLAREGITRLVMTQEFMAPEAYTLLAMLEGIAAGDQGPAIRQRVVDAYARYQRSNYDNPQASARAIFLPR